MARSRLYIWAVVPAVALALWGSAPAISEWADVSHAQAGVMLTVDKPTDGTAVAIGDRLSIGGWAVDPSGGGSAMDPLGSRPAVEVRMYLDGPPNVGRYVGTALSGTPRPDVGNVFGRPEWTSSGFSLDWIPEGPAGDHTLYIQAVSSGGATATASVAVTVRPLARSCSFLSPCVVGRSWYGWLVDTGGPGLFIDRYGFEEFEPGR